MQVDLDKLRHKFRCREVAKLVVANNKKETYYYFIHLLSLKYNNILNTFSTGFSIYQIFNLFNNLVTGSIIDYIVVWLEITLLVTNLNGLKYTSGVE